MNPDQIIIWSSLARHVDDALYMMEDGFHLPQIVLEQSIYVRFLTTSLSKRQRKSLMGVGMPRKSVVCFEGLWAHRPSKPMIDFLEIPSPMGDFLCLFLRIDVNMMSQIQKLKFS